MKKFLTLWLIAGLAVAGMAWLFLRDAGTQASAVHKLRPDDRRLLALGQQVYMAQCAACHGQKLEGQPNWRERGLAGRLPAPPHDASGHTWHHPDELLFRITRNGVAKAAGLKDYDSAMPAYEGVLSDDDIVAVLSWIKSQWPAEVQALHNKVNRQAQAAQ